MPLWKRQEIQEVSWRTNAQGEFEGKGCSFRLPAFRDARNFTVGSGSDEESFPPVAYRVAMPGHHGSATCSPDWPQSLPTPLKRWRRPKPHSGQPNPSRRGFLKGIRNAATVVGSAFGDCRRMDERGGSGWQNRTQAHLFPVANVLFLMRLCSDSACGLHSLQSSCGPLWTWLLRRNLVGLLFSVIVCEDVAGFWAVGTATSCSTVISRL